MKKIILVVSVLCSVLLCTAQVNKLISSAFQEFKKDSQLLYGLSGLHIINAATNEIVFSDNAQIGMAPASTQKNLIAATVLEILGDEYRYITKFGIIKKNGQNILCIQPSGDPSLGSWRWEETKDSVIVLKLAKALIANGIHQINSVYLLQDTWQDDMVPRAWIWEDLGQYYGASPHYFNWRENQFDIFLKSGKNIGDKVSIVKTIPKVIGYPMVSKLTSAEANSEDNSLMFYPVLGSNFAIMRGTIPANKNEFKVSLSMPNPALQFVPALTGALKSKNTALQIPINSILKKDIGEINWLYEHQSPKMAQLVYWYLRKSINLYGEAFLLKMGEAKKGSGNVDNGINTVHEFWKDKGIDYRAIHLYDGSGLSPQNRITPEAEVAVLQWILKSKLKDVFINALPTYNDMKMKSGTISYVKGYTGIHTAKNETTYLFSFLVNNYNGNQLALVRKMYRILDLLK